MEKKRIINVIFLLVIALSMTFSLSSCAKSENVLLSEFKAITEEEPTYIGLEKAVAFIDENSEKLTEEGTSRLILAYEDFLLRFLEKDQAETGQVSEGELFIYTEHLGEDSFKKVDYEGIINKYGEHVSTVLLELLNIKALESKEPAIKDATLQIPYDALLQRALRTEELLNKHSSQDSLKESALGYYKNYLALLLSGSDNSPVFDYQTGEFSPLIMDTYEDFIVENPESISAEILLEYFSYLNSIKFTMDYMDATENKIFYDTCDYLINKAGQSF